MGGSRIKIFRLIFSMAVLLAMYFEAELLGVMRKSGVDPHVIYKDALSAMSSTSAPLTIEEGGKACKTGAQGGHSDSAVPSDAELLYEYSDRGETLEILRKIPPALLAPLTLQAQQLLFDWQHPPSCAGRSFMVSNGNEVLAGLGSHVHIATAHVGLAFEFNSIFIWSREVAEAYTDPVTCEGFPSNNIECFFEPPSNCTLEDAMADGSTMIPVRHGDAGLKLPGQLQFYHVPRQFQELWERAGLPIVRGENTGQQDVVKYWFRLQVASYLSRFNKRSIDIMREMRMNATLMKHIAGPKANRMSADEDSAIRRHGLQTLPHGTISLHIRHGDKHKEMALVPTSAYLQEAARLVKLSPINLAPYRIFLSTEDPGSVNELTESIKKGASERINAFSLDWWDVPRDNSNGVEQMDKFDAIPKARLTLIWWLQLLLALECDAWVGTRGSNWNRLIDELRCVWVAKCQNIYSEVGDFEKWENIAWRL